MRKGILSAIAAAIYGPTMPLNSFGSTKPRKARLSARKARLSARKARRSPHQGEQEKARRVRQLEKGIIQGG